AAQGAEARVRAAADCRYRTGFPSPDQRPAHGRAVGGIPGGTRAADTGTVAGVMPSRRVACQSATRHAPVYSPMVSSEALPPAAVVLMVSVRSVAKRSR